MKCVSYREIEGDDLNALSDIAQCSDITQLTLFSQAIDRGETLKDVFQILADENKKTESIKTFGILSEGNLVGFMTKYRRDDTLQLSYSIAHNHRKKGIATAAVRQMIATLSEDERKLEIQLSIAPDNIASIRVAEKLHFTAHGINVNGKVAFSRSS